MKYLALYLCALIIFPIIVFGQNVGIGTPSPSEKLDVDGKVRIRGGELWFTDNNDLDDYIYGPVNRNLNVRIQANNDTDDFSVEVDNGSGTYVDEFSVNRVESYFRGNLGIGTTAPGKKLEVHHNTDVIANFKRTNSNSVGISLEGNDGSLTRIYGAQKAMRVFHTPSGGSASEVFTIEPNGNTSISGGLDLANGTFVNEFSVDGTLGSNSDNALPTERAVKTYVDNQVGGNDDWDKSGNDIFNNNSGSVGIGISSPNAKLNINTASAATYPAAQLFFSLDGASGAGSYSMGIDPSDGDKFKIGNSWNPASGTFLTLTNSGDLGIGTSNPAEKLHIDGSVRGNQSGGALRINTANGYIDVGPRNTSWSHFTTDRPRFWFNTGLTVNGGEIGSYSGSNLSLQTNGTTRMTMLSSNGNVGIGTTSPGYKLQVNGSARVNSLNINGAYNLPISDGSANYVLRTNGSGGVSWTDPNSLVNGDNLGNHTATQNINMNWAWNSSSLSGNSIYAQSGSNGFAFGNGTGVSTWFSYDGTVRRGIDVYNDGSRVILGTDGANVGVNTASPSAKLDVNGSTKLKTLNQGARDNERFYPNVISDAQNTTVNGAWIVHTPIPRNSNKMFKIRVHGYGYGSGDVIDFTISGYSYSGSSGNIDGASGGVVNYELSDQGTDNWDKYIGVDANGNVAVAFGNSGSSAYYYRMSVDAWITRSTTDYSTGWSIDRSTTSNFSWKDKKGPLTANWKRTIYINSSENVGIGGSPDNSYKLRVHGKLRSDGINETSDARLKKNVKSVSAALDKVMALRGVNYEWKTEEFPDKNFSKGTELGVIAQEVEQVLPEVVDTDSEGYKSVQYSHIVPVLIEAIKEQQAIIDRQDDAMCDRDQKIEALTQKVDNLSQLEAEVAALKEMLEMSAKK